MLNYFNVYMYVPGTSYQTLNENIFLSCVLMWTIFPKSLFTQIWIKKLRNHATRCSLRKQSPLLVLHCKECFAGYTWCVKSKWEMFSLEAMQEQSSQRSIQIFLYILVFVHLFENRTGSVQN